MSSGTFKSRFPKLDLRSSWNATFVLPLVTEFLPTNVPRFPDEVVRWLRASGLRAPYLLDLPTL